MICSIMLKKANDLKDFMIMACESDSDVGVHTDFNQIADGKSILGLIALDYSKPVKVVSEDKKFMEKISKWAVD